MGRTRLIGNTSVRTSSNYWLERKEIAEKRKNELIKYLENLKQQYKAGKISYSRYVEILHQKKDGRTIEEWIWYYNSESINSRIEYDKSKRKKTIRRMFILLFFSLAVISLIFLQGKINSIGFASKETSLNLTIKSYSENINENFETSGDYIWNPENLGSLDSIKLSGSIEGDGEAKIYFGDLLIFDTGEIKTGSKSITALAVNEDNSVSEGETSEVSETNGGEGSQGDSSPSQESSPPSGTRGVPEENPQENTENQADENNQENPSNSDEINPEEVPKEDSSPSQGSPSESDKKTRSFSKECIETCKIEGIELQEENEIRIEISGDAKLRIKKIDYGIVSSNEIEVPVEESPTEVPIEEVTPQTNTSSNITSNETTSIENANITTKQYGAVIGKPVRWIKEIKLETAGQITIKIPEGSENITVNKIIEDETSQGTRSSQSASFRKEKAKATITGNIISGSNNESFILNLIKRIFSAITGNAIEETGIDIIIDDSANNYEIEYYTESPQATEREISKGKEVTISAPDELGYTNILAFSELSKEAKKGKIKLYHLENGERVQTEFTEYDLNNNSLIDYIEWTVPHLSSQTYEIIIEITSAEHLNENRTFIEDVYNLTYTKDNNWTASIPENHFIRVSFEQNLTNQNDIKVYARSNNSANLNIYKKDSIDLLASIEGIQEGGYYRVYLENLNGTYADFDLEVSNGEIEFDHIIDPSQNATGSGTTSQINFSLSTPVNTSSSFVVFTAGTVDITPDDWQYTSNLTNSTQVSFTRYDGGGISSDISFEVIDEEYFIVQRGTQTLSTGINETEISINAVDPGRTFVIVNGRCADETSNDNLAGFFAGNITSSTTLLLRRGNGNLCASTVSWQVVQVIGGTVQSGEARINDNEFDTEVNLTTTVDTSKTFLIFGSASLGTDPGMDSNLISESFNSSRIYFTLNPGASYPSSLRIIDWYLVTIPQSQVQSGSNILSFPNEHLNVSISSVNTSQSFLISSFYTNGGGQSYSNGQYIQSFLNSTTISFDKITTSNTINVSWQVINFPQSDSEISWNVSTIDLGGTNPNNGIKKTIQVNSTAISTDVEITSLGGNGSSFISTTPTYLGNFTENEMKEVNISCQFIPALPPGTYQEIFNVNSIEDPDGDNVTAFCTIEDVQNPSVENLLPPNDSSYPSNTSVNINVSVFDDWPIDSVILNLTYPNASSQEIPLNNYELEPDSNTRLYLHLNNDSSIGENDTHIVDSSSFSKNGTFGPGASFSSSSYLGDYALDFNGSSYALISNDNLNFEEGDNFSISLWVNTTGNSLAMLANKDYVSGGFGIYLDGGRPSIVLQTGATVLVANKTVGDSTWHNLVYVRANSTVSIYVDGVLDAIGTDASTNLSVSTDLILGSRSTVTFTIAYNGLIDDLYVLDRALTQEEIQANRYRHLFNNTQQTGNYNVTIVANDTNGNLNDSEKTNFTIFSGLLQWAVSNLSLGETGLSHNISKNTTVNSLGINTDGTITAINGSGTFITVNNSYIGNFTNGQSKNVSFICSKTIPVPVGEYLRIFKLNSTEDPAGHQINVTCNITDILAPNVTNLLPPAGENFSKNFPVEINATVVDDSYIDAVLANITLPNGTSETHNLVIAEQTSLDNVRFLMHFENDSSIGETQTLAVDSSIYSINGTISPGNIFSPGQIGNKSIKFDGSSFVNTSDNPALGFSEGDNFSISFWTNNTDTGTHVYVNKNYASSGYMIYRTGGQLIFTVDNTAYSVAAFSTANDGKWHNIIGKRGNGLLSIYVDGKLENTAFDGSGILNNSDDLLIGALRDTGILGTQGEMDEVIIFNKSLSDEEIQLVYKYHFTSTSQIGRYNVTILANDTSGNLNDSEETFFSISQVPTQGIPILNSTFGTNRTDENLTLYNISTSDTEGDPIRNIYNWYVDNKSITILNMPFEGGSNSTTTRDYSRGLNGTVTNAFYNNTGGYDGKGAYEFNGIQGNILLSDNDYEFGNGAFTLMAWVYPKSVKSNSVFSKRQGTNNGYRLRLGNAGNFRFLVDNGPQASVFFPYQLNKWQFVVGTFNGTNLSLYIDGVLKNSTLITAGSTDNTRILRIGANSNLSGAAVFNGSIDEAKIFNRSLSAEEVFAIFQNKTNYIVSQETIVGETWHGCITPNDGLQDGSTNCSIGLTIVNASTAPQVTFVSPIQNTNPVEGTNTTVKFFATVYDADGVADINDTSIRANFTRVGEPIRENNSCVLVNDIDANSANYSCTIDMFYFDEAGNWNVTVLGGDLSGINATNTTTYFQYNLLQAIILDQPSLSFNVTQGSFNQSANNNPLRINNTGNDNLTEKIAINAINLLGETNPNEFINVSNFTAGVVSGSECSATRLQNSTDINITGIVLERGNLSSEETYFCLAEVDLLSTQQYSTQGAGSWLIKIAVLLVSTGRRKKKRKLIAEDLSVPSSIFSEDKIGALESIVKYCKENLNMKYSEIAKLLNRDQRTIWTAYKKSLEKKEEKIEVKESLAFLPVSIFKNRKFTILEAIVVYLKEKGLRYVEIGDLLNRDQRNIWTIYSRTRKD